MPTFEMICLANSKKYQGRCIAGLKTDGSGWLRPVSAIDTGALYSQDYILNNGCEPQLFDIIRIECTEPRAKCHQPENWIISKKEWEFVGTPTLEQLQAIINPEVIQNSASMLLRNRYSQICYAELEEFPANSSLALIHPHEFKFTISKQHHGQKKFRGKFKLNDIEYNLPITDLAWQSKLSTFEERTYSCQEVIERLKLTDFNSKGFLLTISLSEPFIPNDGDSELCYKLIAAIINSYEVKKRFGFH